MRNSRAALIRRVWPWAGSRIGKPVDLSRHIRVRTHFSGHAIVTMGRILGEHLFPARADENLKRTSLSRARSVDRP